MLIFITYGNNVCDKIITFKFEGYIFSSTLGMYTRLFYFNDLKLKLIMNFVNKLVKVFSKLIS